MSTVYVVRPDVRGVYYYDGWCIEHACMTPPSLNIFSVEEPFLQTTVQRCTVRPNSVCEHGWFCTDNRDVAVMVNELRGERAAVVALLRKEARRMQEMHGARYAAVALRHFADLFERGEHRREEER